MKRTTVVFPHALRARAKRRAREQGWTFSEFVRRAVERALEEQPRRDRDPVFDVTLFPEIRRRDGS